MANEWSSIVTHFRTMLSILVFILIGSVHCQLAMENMPSVNEFNISELNLYNNMVSCVATFKLQFVHCNKQLQRLARNVFKLIQENSTMGGIIKCCGIWMARDCWLSHARQNCIDEHISDIYILPFKLLPKLDKWCHIYHDQTFVCSLPYYLPIAFLLAAIITTIAVMVYIAYKLRSKQKQKQTQLKNVMERNTNESSAVDNLLDQNQNIRE